MILRVLPDWGRLAWKAGQYTVLGLGNWERRVASVQAEPLGNDQPCGVVRRAYSISCPMLDSSGRLVVPGEEAELEFYVALVRHAAHPPALTPRLFALHPRDRICVGEAAHGHYSVECVGANDAAVFVATGTGEAPHNAMIARLLAAGHRGPIAAVVCTRYRRDLGYLPTYRRIEAMFPNVRYICLTTREPENVDPAAPGYVGKCYIQDFFADGRFERETGIALRPGGLHVFLCGNPEMIGVPHHTYDLSRRYPTPRGMIEILERRGLAIDRPDAPGSIHFEKYW
jgi:ferredoxin--NADP+ reductase